MPRLCLLCRTDEDATPLTRIPVRAEGQVIGALLVCGSCIEATGVERLKPLLQTAIDEKSYPAESFLSAAEPAEAPSPADGEDNGDRDIELSLPREALVDPDELAKALGSALASLLHAEYRQGRGRVNLATSLVPDGESFRFRAVLLPD